MYGSETPTDEVFGWRGEQMDLAEALVSDGKRRLCTAREWQGGCDVPGVAR
jgi:hypothetical protein